MQKDLDRRRISTVSVAHKHRPSDVTQECSFERPRVGIWAGLEPLSRRPRVRAGKIPEGSGWVPSGPNSSSALPANESLLRKTSDSFEKCVTAFLMNFSFSFYWPQIRSIRGGCEFLPQEFSALLSSSFERIYITQVMKKLT